MVGKNGPIFPMIGKIFRPFSNDWKKISAHFQETKRTKRSTKQPADKTVGQFRQFPTIVGGDNLGVPGGQLRPAEEDTNGKREARKRQTGQRGAPCGRECGEENGRDSSHKGHKERAENKRKNHPHLGGATFQSRPNGWSAGGMREGNTPMPLRGLGWLGVREGCLHGKPGKPFRGQERAWGANGGKQLGQLGTTLARCAPQAGRKRIQPTRQSRVFCKIPAGFLAATAFDFPGRDEVGDGAGDCGTAPSEQCNQLRPGYPRA